jgi:hypothetical protein
LVKRLQTKIDQIKFSIGTDQSVLGEEANPLEFVDIYDPQRANDAIDRMDDDGLLLSEDEFVNDLRWFDRNAIQADKDLVDSIGRGKWGQLPVSSGKSYDDVSSLSLVAIDARETVSGVGRTSHLFVKNVNGGFGPMEIFKALASIRVSADSSRRHRDLIAIDRDIVAEKVLLVAKVNVKRSSGYFKFTKTVHDALNAVTRARPEVQLAKALGEVVNRQSRKRAFKIVKQVNQDIKNVGEVSETTMQDVVSFVRYVDAGKLVSEGETILRYESLVHFGR